MRTRFAIVACAVLFTAGGLCAATVSKLSDDAFAPLREAGVRRKIRLSVPLYGEKHSSIELEEFQVWAPGGKIVIHRESGIERVDPPVRRFYRGLVDGEPESFAFFSVDPATNAIEGLIAVRENKFAVAGRRTANARPGPARFDDFLTAVDPEDEIPDSALNWQCAVDKIKPAESNKRLHATGPNGLPVVSNGISGTQSYAITVEIETDNEFYVNAGSNATTASNYITGLTGAVSTIYNRDLKTNVTQSAVNIYTSASDPWLANGTDQLAALLEVGDYYHNLKAPTFPKPAGRTTSAVVMMSGKSIGAGIAWEAVICGADFPFGPDFGGPYSWCGGIGNLFGFQGLGTIPNVDTPPFNMPAGTGGGNVQSFWPLEEYAHELGHNMGGHHTHCIPLTVAEQTATGRAFVDICTAFEAPSGCSSAPAAAPVEKGTIMSYCHNIFSGLAPQSRYTLGQVAPDVSHHELDEYMLRGAGPLLGGTNIVNGVGTFTISAITAPASVPAGSTGNAASITPIGGATYAWTIANGTITGGQGTPSITFTAGVAGTITLNATAYGANRCGVTDTKSIVCAVGFNPPTNVVATYGGTTFVTVSWNAPSGSPPSQYNVYRSTPTDYTNFVLIASPTGTMASDGSVSLNEAYLYKVRSAGPGGTNESGDSNSALATIVVYANPALSAVTSGINAVDMTDLRTAATAVRTLAILGAFPYANPSITAGVSTVQAVDLTDVRSAINAALSTMGLPPLSVTDSSIIVGTTGIKAAHINEIRAGVQ